MSSLKKNVNKFTIESLVTYVSEIVAKESGNVLGKTQESMVLNRLKKRLIDLGELSPDQYYQHLSQNYHQEATHLVSLLTTHHTFFFREFCHFEYIIQNLDSIVENAKQRGDKKIKILSAACSRGQEVYSLAMLMNHHLKKYPDISFEILGTDIDPESVKIGENGVYPYNEIKSIPNIYMQGNWQRGTGNISRFAKIKNHIKDHCTFKVMNLLKINETLISKKFDLIFCRNVFIYFDLPSITKIVTNFKTHLYPNALFITGLSESLNSVEIEKQTHSASVYCFDKPEKSPHIEMVPNIQRQEKVITSKIPVPIKIVCVDDSLSILKLLTKIFNDDSDFELVGTAENGIQAQEFIKNNKVDAMTLDIHMPEMDGVEYLKKNFNSSHPNVIVVSSASREDTRYAQETLKNGASDFVEKPALNNLKERADELKNKIKMSFLNESHVKNTLDLSFSKNYEFEDTSNKARIFVATYSDKKKVLHALKELRGKQPPTFLFFEGNNNYLEVIKEELSSVTNIELFNGTQEVHDNIVYLCDFKQQHQEVFKVTKNWKISFAIFGIVSKSVSDQLHNLENTQVLLEDLPGINEDIKQVVNDIFPWTSFTHIGTEFLTSKK